MAGRTGSPGDSLLGRAHRILRAFSEDAPELDVPTLVRLTGVPRSTVHRLAAQLVALGLLDRTENGYSVGTGLWEIGELSRVSLLLRERALPHLLTLYEATAENVHLAALAGSEALYIARLTGPASIPTLSRMGGRLPLHTTGVGKALLATRDEEWLADYFRTPRERETIHSIVDEGALRRELDETRARGYAVTRQEMTLGNVSIAAALPAVRGLPRSAIGVVTHLATADQSRIGPLMVRTAARIGEDLAH